MGLQSRRLSCNVLPFVAMRRRQFRLYWSSSLIFDIAQWAQMGILAWLLLELTGSPLFMLPYTVSRFLPKILLAPVAGVVADRVNRHKMLIISQSAILAVTIVMAILVAYDGMALWSLLAMNAVLGIAFSFEQPARRALVPSLVERDDLLCAVSLNNSAFNIAVIAGPIVGTALPSVLSGAGALYVNAALFAVPLVLLLCMGRVSHAIDASERSSIGGHFLDGLKYLRNSPVVAGLLLVSLFPGFLDRLFVLFLPLLAHGTTEVASAAGDFMPVIRGSGAVAGTLGLAAWSGLRVRGSIVMPIALACAASSALFIFAPWLSLSMVVLAMAGLLRAVLSSVTTTLLHTSIPDGLRGRIMAI